MEWSTSDTVATIAAIAQVSAAVFTAVMARRTHGLATETAEMAKETQRAANAAETQAKATETLVAEAQLDREASWSPYLTSNVITATNNASGAPGSPQGYSQTLTLTNLGRGQAMNCAYVARPANDSQWCWIRHPGLAGGDSADELTAHPGDGEPPWELLDPSPHDPDQTARLEGALFCEDVFGNRIRFPIGRRGRDICRPEDDHPPAWATSPRIWP
ncbi:hypothetical protein [Sinomonas sp. G460-2]|uniref:hypothetical protein n=1 Tax=Sinomonas sp. G460-2 TaxID=3393464 RepID=UPI0039EF8B0E